MFPEDDCDPHGGEPRDKGCDDERPELSDAELEVLKALWSEGPSVTTRVREVMNARGRNWAYATTKTMLDRLEQKGYVRRSRESIPHVFTPSVSADGLARIWLQRIQGRVFDGARLPLVRALLDSARLSREEVRELRASLDDLETANGTDD